MANTIITNFYDCVKQLQKNNLLDSKIIKLKQKFLDDTSKIFDNEIIKIKKREKNIMDQLFMMDMEKSKN